MPPDPAHRHRSDVLTDSGLLALALIWGINFSVIKVALGELHPLAFNALRFPVASVVLLVLLRASGPLALPDARDWPRLVLMGLLGNLVYQLLFIFGIDRTTAGNASLLLATTPAWTLLLTVVVGHERPPPVVWTGVLGTVAGMTLVVAGGSGFRPDVGSLAGDMLMVGASMLWSLYTVGVRDLIHRYGPLEVTAWTLWIGTLGLVVVGAPAVAETPLTSLSAGTWAAVAYAGTFALSIAYAIWYRGVHRIGNARTAAYSNLVPVVALGVAWLWLGERPAALQVVGAGVILGGLSLARLGGRTPVFHPPEPE